MKTTIKTYDDLLAYQQQLKDLLVIQKQVIRYDIQELKKELNPLTTVARVASKFFTSSKDHSMLVKVASSLTNIVLKKVILSRAGWLTRLTIPFLAKNMSSHLVADHKDGILDKLLAVVAHKKKKRV